MNLITLLKESRYEQMGQKKNYFFGGGYMSLSLEKKNVLCVGWPGLIFLFRSENIKPQKMLIYRLFNMLNVWGIRKKNADFKVADSIKTQYDTWVHTFLNNTVRQKSKEHGTPTNIIINKYSLFVSSSPSNA